ncbi:MAG: sulfatase [Candidatus Thermoplasmatota archaeon]
MVDKEERDIKNIFLVTVDDLRADHLGCKGYKKDVTPNIDEFAERNILFTNAFSNAPQTTISFPSILYGAYASNFFNKRNYLKKKSIAGALREKGYKTLAFNSNPHFKMWGFSKGFDFFEDFLSETGSERDKTFEKVKKKFVKKIGKRNIIFKSLSRVLSFLGADIAQPYADAELMNERFFEEIDDYQGEKVFCWMHYMDPHYPFFPKDEFLEEDFSEKEILRLNRLQRRALHFNEDIPREDVKKMIMLYDAEIKFFDSQFKIFIEELKERGMYDDSLIVFTSDHGELFGEHGRFGHDQDVLYQKQLEVPLIVKTPDVRNDVYQKITSLITVPSTIYDYVDGEENFFDMPSLWDREKYIINEGFNWDFFKKRRLVKKEEIMVSCRKDNWKLIIDNIHNRRELYDLSKDSEELNNVYGFKTKEVDVLEKIVDNHLKESLEGERDLVSDKIKRLKKSGKI